MVLASLLTCPRRLPGGGSSLFLSPGSELSGLPEAALSPCSDRATVRLLYLIYSPLPRVGCRARKGLRAPQRVSPRGEHPGNPTSRGGLQREATVSTVPGDRPYRGTALAGAGVRHPGAAAPEPQDRLQVQSAIAKWACEFPTPSSGETRGADADRLRPSSAEVGVRTHSGGRGVIPAPRSQPLPGSWSCARRGRGVGGAADGPPHSPAFPAAAGTDVAAVRAAILWEQNQRLARSSSCASAAEGVTRGWKRPVAKLLWPPGQDQLLEG
ncbi:ADP-ribosylation factor 1 isoform X1 [Rhinolophus ferrumequinum]|uniref:ADP-ribosylation factor 1 isoform X1 n=1 Tax=Rhinolophus ferrumequinum TaxID=59479 RepID=UPI00140FE3CB|nr:ADP-ribosylation factor 1 isoform X1 [Rhinolophus ferrumequinum]XP_032951701.1 ADP-ribosylation factor 1 isoform X1 [Rhinolophus ferrumequinum]